MIPIINVIFLLLIFFLAQGSFKQAEPLGVKVPVSSSGQSLGADATQIFLTKDGLQIGSEAVDDETFKGELQEIARQNPSHKFLLKADAGVDSTRLIEVLKLVKQAHVENLYMVTAAKGKS